MASPIFHRPPLLLEMIVGVIYLGFNLFIKMGAKFLGITLDFALNITLHVFWFDNIDKNTVQKQGDTKNCRCWVYSEVTSV